MHFLILDEPTNHLDVRSREILLDALKDFTGTVILVSHERHFLRALVSKVIEIDHGAMTVYDGDYAYYLHKSGREAHGGVARQTGQGSVEPIMLCGCSGFVSHAKHGCTPHRESAPILHLTNVEAVCYVGARIRNRKMMFFSRWFRCYNLPSLLPAFLLVFGQIFVTAAVADEAVPFAPRAAAYLVKRDGQLLWAHNDRERLPPASLTKIMTALVALDQGGLERVVTVSAAAAAETGSQIGLRAGDRLTLHDLLRATLIKSANDACHAVAEAVAGDTESFIRMMNARAVLLGLQDTHYADVSGHDRDGHYTSARDLAILAETAMRNPLFRTMVATEALKIRTVDGRRTFRLRTSNRLIGSLPDVTGVKTGYTQGAGRCLVAMAERGDSRVLLVLLNDPGRWRDAPRLLEEAFRQPLQVQAAVGSLPHGRRTTDSAL